MFTSPRPGAGELSSRRDNSAAALDRRRAATAVVALLVVLLSAGPAAAQTSGSWTDAGPTFTWNSAGNWLGGIPDLGGTATFGAGNTANRTVDLNVSVTLGGLAFTNTANPFTYTITPSAGSSITFAGGSSITNSALSSSTVGAGLSLNGNLAVTGAGFGNITLGGIIANGSGTGSLLINTTPQFSETGVVTLSGANTFTGGVTLQSGNLLLANNAALGTGALTISGANTTLHGNGSAVTNGIVLMGSGATGGALTFAGSGSLSIVGVISNDSGTGNTGGLTNISRGGTLTLTGANTYTGATVATTNTFYVAVAGFNTPGGQNAITLSGGGTALGSASFTATGGSSIILDNSGIAPAISRIGSAAPVSLNNGTFRLNGSSDAAAFTQNAGPLTGTGFSTVAVSSAAGGGATTLNFASLNRGPAGTGTFLFLGNGGLGSGPANVTFATPPITATGLGTPAASIIPYAIGDVTIPGTGTNFVTYDVNGVRPLNGSETVGTLSVGQNVRLIGTATNSGTLAVNSLALTGTANYTVSGGTLTVSSGSVLAVNTNTTAIPTTFTLGSNLAFGSTQANVFVPNGNVAGATNTLSLTGTVSGSGGLVKSGTGTLALASGNTYSGGTVVNEGFITFADPSAFGSGPITINSRQSAQAAGITLSTPAAVTLNGVTVNTGSGAFNAPSSGLIILAGTVAGTGSVTTSGGTVALTGSNTFTGTSRTNGGALFFASDANLGTSPILTLSNISAVNAVVLGGNWTTGKNILANPGSSSGFNTNGFNATTAGGSGVLLGSGGLTKTGAGTLTLTNQNLYSGALTVNGGTVALAGNGILTGTNSITIASGGLSLDNTTTVVSNRLSSGATVTYFNGVGTLSINSGGGAVTQQLAGLTASGGSGMGAVRLDASVGGTVVVTAGAYTITGGNSPSLFVAGTNLGGTGSGSTQLIFTTLAPLAGNGAAGTHTVGVLRGGYGDTVATGNGSGLLTQATAGTSVRLLNEATEYAVNAQEANANTLINGSAPTFSTGTINSLLLKNGNALTITSGQTLTLTSGTIVSAGGTNDLQGTGLNGGGATLASPAVGGIQSGFIFAISSDLTSNVVFNGAGAGSRLVKLGPGTLTLDPRDASGNVVAGTSGTVSDIRFYGGTVAVTNPNQTINAVGGGNLFFANDGQFRFAGVGLGTSRTFNFLGSGGRLDLSGTAIQTNPTTAALTGPGVLTLTGGTLSLGSGSAATPNVLQPNSISGGITLQGGTLALNSSDAALLGTGPLTLAGGTLAARFADRTVAVPVYANASTTFTNNLTISLPTGIADGTNSGLVFVAPVRLNNSVTFTNAMTSTAAGNGNVTFNSAIYDNPFNPGQSVTFAASGASPGRFVLNTGSLYTGGTTITSGATVLANNSTGSATGTGGIAVGAGGRLAGTGFVVPTGSGNVAVGGSGGNSAVLSPGNGAALGTLTVGSAANPGVVALNSHSTLEFFFVNNGTLNPAAANTGGSSNGTNSNRLTVLGASGSLVIADPGTLTIRLIGDSTAFQGGETYSFVLATAGSVMAVGITDPARFDTSGFTGFAGGTFSVTGSGDTLYLNFTPVPEPAGALLVCAIGAAGIRFLRPKWRRRDGPPHL